MCGLRKGAENVCILSRLIASLKSDISARLRAILETFLTVLIKIQVVTSQNYRMAYLPAHTKADME